MVSMYPFSMINESRETKSSKAFVGIWYISQFLIYQKQMNINRLPVILIS